MSLKKTFIVSFYAIIIGILHLLSLILGSCLYLLFHKRRRILLSNLSHVYHKWSYKKLNKFALFSCIRTVELGMLSFVLPILPTEIIKRRFSIDNKLKKLINNLNHSSNSMLILIPHCSHLDAITVLPLLFKINNPEKIGVLFRPFKNSFINKWIIKSREKHGFVMISRKSGLIKAKSILQNNGVLALLFDQNAKFSGVLSQFCNQLASTTPLPQKLAEHFRCEIHVVYPKYKKFFSSQFTTDTIQYNQQETHSITTNMNLWLENKLKSDLNFSKDWLWIHNRWNICYDQESLFNLPYKSYISDINTPNQIVKTLIRIPHNSLNIEDIIATITSIRNTRKDLTLYLLISKYDINYRHICKSLKLHTIQPSQILQCRTKCFRYCIFFENSLKTKLEQYLIGAAKNIYIND